MSLENDLKLEIKQNKEYINNLLEQNEHLNNMLESLQKRQAKDELIIPSLRAKMKKYYDLYHGQLESMKQMEEENKHYREEVWNMREEVKQMEVEISTLRNKDNDDKTEPLVQENNVLIFKIDALNKKIEQLEEEVKNERQFKERDNPHRRVSSVTNCNSTFLKDNNHSDNEFNDTNLLLKQADDIIRGPMDKEEEKDLIDDLERVLRTYQRKFDEEDAKKKKIDQTFKLFERIKERMMNKEETPKRDTVETPMKLNNLERKIESISETLARLVEKKETKSKKPYMASTIKRYPKLDLDDVSVNESQMDVLGQRRSSEIEQTQVKQNIMDNIERNVSNATSRTLNSVRNGLDNMDTLNKICAEFEGREVNIDEIVDNH
ncbi:uncharacterized protein HGUI_03858 [Hanseniaspora guilliermondii]|uniref:Uncharacterized protein n=1 Tax=Hanseniaspora guilliermondii TaxID=56406 RepID=A0A1L0CSS5_9ASCO|nr:uncharacterized protein HGUI_03858 [Hanseniaspora guilliermondii]